jgi:hypothetical protein
MQNAPTNERISGKSASNMMKIEWPEANLLGAHMKCIGKGQAERRQYAVKNSPNIIDFKEATRLIAAAALSIHRVRLNRGAFKITAHLLMNREM